MFRCNQWILNTHKGPMWVKYWHICRSTLAKYYDYNWIQFCETQLGMSNLSKSQNHTFQTMSSVTEDQNKFESCAWLANGQIDLSILEEWFLWNFINLWCNNINILKERFIRKPDCPFPSRPTKPPSFRKYGLHYNEQSTSIIHLNNKSIKTSTEIC